MYSIEVFASLCQLLTMHEVGDDELFNLHFNSVFAHQALVFGQKGTDLVDLVLLNFG